jgi:hypothetical protein
MLSAFWAWRRFTIDGLGTDDDGLARAVQALRVTDADLAKRTFAVRTTPGIGRTPADAVVADVTDKTVDVDRAHPGRETGPAVLVLRARSTGIGRTQFLVLIGTPGGIPGASAITPARSALAAVAAFGAPAAKTEPGTRHRQTGLAAAAVALLRAESAAARRRAPDVIEIH